MATKKKTVKELLAERENIDAKKKEINKALRAARAAEKAEKERQEREKEISEALDFYRRCRNSVIRIRGGDNMNAYNADILESDLVLFVPIIVSINVLSCQLSLKSG